MVGIAEPTIGSSSPNSDDAGCDNTGLEILTLIPAAYNDGTAITFDGMVLDTATANSAWGVTTETLENGIDYLTADLTANFDSIFDTLLVTQVTTLAHAAPITATDTTVNTHQVPLHGSEGAVSAISFVNTVLGAIAANNSGSWGTATGAPIDSTDHATHFDITGNDLTESQTTDATTSAGALAAPVIATDAIVNTNEVMLTGTAEANSTVTVLEGAAQIGTAAANGSGVWSFLTGPLPGGAHTFTAIDTDAAGHGSAASQPLDPTTGVIYYVSPTGNDASSGLAPNSAFATLGAAIAAMATDGAPDTTDVLNGTYYLNGTTLSLTSANSNDTIEASAGASPIISGGTPVPSTGWSVGPNGIWSIELSNDTNVEQLVVNGQAQSLARYPNEVPTNPIEGGWLWAQSLPSGDNPLTQMAYNPADFAAGQQPTAGEQVTVYDQNNWSSSVLTITSVNTTTDVITFDQPAWFDIGLGSRYFISNSQALLDQPGEWYFNKATHTLYYDAPAGFTGSGAVVSGNTSLINISNAQNITIQGLSFSDAATNAENDYITTAAVNINSSSGITVNGNSFNNVAQGVQIAGASYNNTVSNNNFGNIWAQAVEVGEGSSLNIITHNSIQNSGEVFVGAGAIELDNTWNDTVSYNLIQNVPRAGISDFQTASNVQTGANTIEYNTILNSNQTTNDSGAIYAYSGGDTSALGDTIKYNTIVNPGGLGTTSSGFISGNYWSAGIYMDTGTSNEQIYGNLIEGGTYGGVFLAGGNNNHVWNNIIVEPQLIAGGGGGNGILLGAYSNTTPMSGTEVYDNIIQTWANASAIGFQSGIVSPSNIYQNIYYSPNGVSPQIGNITFSQWQALGGDQGSSVTSDPGFANAANNDYQLGSGSYALSFGFQNLPWAQMAQAGSAILPTVTSIVYSGTGISNGNGDLSAGHVVTLTLNMSEAVTVNTTNGTPTLTLNDGATATYTGGSGSSALTFSYTVAAGQNTPDLTVSAVNLNSATIADGAGNNASFSGTFTFNPTGTLQIDTSTPTVASVTTSGTGISSGSGDLNADHVVTLTLNMSEVVTVNTTGGTPTLTLNDGATATYTGGSGSSALTFSYTVAAGQNTPDLTVSAVNLNGATVADAAGNNTSLSGTFNPTGTLQIDTSTPTVASVTTSGTGISSGSGDLNADHVVTLTLNMSEVVTVNTTGGTPTLTLNDGATATYTGGSGSSALTFSYIVAAGQNTPDLTVSAVNLNSATIADGAGNNASLSGTFTFNPTGTLQIDTSTPTVASVTTSGTGISSGSGDLNADHVVTLTLNMSEVVTVNTTGGTPTLTLNDGATATYTGGSGSSALTFSYTVAAGQNIPDLMVSAVNLNGATVADAAGNNTSLSGTFNPTGTLQIDTIIPPPPIISTDAINANNSITLTGTAEANSSLTIYDGQTVLGTTTTTAGGMWNYTTGSLASGAQVFTAVATDTAGNTSALSNSVDPIIGPATTAEVTAIYNAVLQRAPTDTEITASLAIDSTLGSSGMIAAIADSAEAITNVYPILQMFDLAFGRFPSAATLASMVDTELSVSQLAAAVVASQTFADTYNSGALINPNSPLTAGIVDAFYSQALGHAPTQETLNGWLNGGLTVVQAFLAMVTSQSYFEAAQPAIEQYLTTAAVNNEGYPVSGTAADLNPTQVGVIYEAVLQRAPTATEMTASLALDSVTGNVGVIAALINSPEAITNVYPLLQMFDLAFGHFPVAATLASMVETGLAVPQLAAAIVASQTFGDIYNDGTLINPNSPVTANIVEVLYTQALGHAPTQATLNGWLSSGLTIAHAFEDMVTSQSYFATAQSSIEQYLTAAAISEAGLTTINGTQASGTLELGTDMMPLTQPGLTVLGGSGALTVVASGAGDTVAELNTSAAGGTIAANGAGDTITAANGPNTITANGAGDTINLGVVSTGISISSAQTIHAAGAAEVITFATTAADGTALTWAAASTVDGGNGLIGIDANSTVNFGNNAVGGSETVSVTGDLSGATTSGGTSTAGLAMITLGNVVDGAGDQIIFNNAATEVLAGTNAVNVTAAGSLAQALDMAASAAGNSTGGMIPAHAGVIDWFQYGSNTYVVEAINLAGSAANHPALATTDEVIKIVGLVNLAGESLVGHALTL